MADPITEAVDTAAAALHERLCGSPPSCGKTAFRCQPAGIRRQDVRLIVETAAPTILAAPRGRSLAVLAYAEGEYVRAVNAVLASPDQADPDANRWRGHAEAYRAMAERLRLETPGLLPVDYRGQEWRDANGVYTDEQVMGFRRAQRAGVARRG